MDSFLTFYSDVILDAGRDPRNSANIYQVGLCHSFYSDTGCVREQGCAFALKVVLQGFNIVAEPVAEGLKKKVYSQYKCIQIFIKCLP